MVPNPRELCNSIHSLNTDWPQSMLAWVKKPDGFAWLLEALLLWGLNCVFMLLAVWNWMWHIFCLLEPLCQWSPFVLLGGCQATQVDCFLFLFAWATIASLGDATTCHFTQVDFFVCFCLLEPLWQCHVCHASCTFSSNFFPVHLKGPHCLGDASHTGWLVFMFLFAWAHCCITWGCHCSA